VQDAYEIELDVTALDNISTDFLCFS